MWHARVTTVSVLFVKHLSKHGGRALFIQRTKGPRWSLGPGSNFSLHGLRDIISGCHP